MFDEAGGRGRSGIQMTEPGQFAVLQFLYVQFITFLLFACYFLEQICVLLI